MSKSAFPIPVIDQFDAALSKASQCDAASATVPEVFNFARDVIDHAAAHADKVAAIEISKDGTDVREYRFSDISQRSIRVANALYSLGLRRGDHVVLIMPRSVAWHEVMLACIRLGVVAMPGTNLLTGRDIAYRVSAAGAVAVIVGEAHVARVDDALDASALRTRIVTGGASPAAGWSSLTEAMAGVDSEPCAAALEPTRSDETMLAYYTSGTTGHPKLVPRNHGYALAHLITTKYWYGLDADDIHWTLTDTGWSKAAWGLIFGPWLAGATIVVHDPDGFDPEHHLKLLGKLGVTSFCAPPTVFRMLVQQDLAAFDLSSISKTLAAGEPLNPEAIRAWSEATGTFIRDGYGQTETVCLAANGPDMEVRAGSMGKSVPCLDVAVVDDAGEHVPDGEIGHIAVRLTDPAPLGLFDGYRKLNGEFDRSAFRNGWYYTGDTATRDKDGYIWFVGRADDVISSSGYRISPFEVESALLEHAAVLESAVIGLADELRGELVVAHVVLAEGFHGDDKLVEALQEHVKTVTAPYKYPRRIVFQESLPKTISGKIRRVELRGQSI